MLRLNNQNGQLSLAVLIFGSIAIIMLSGFVFWADTNLKSVYRITDRALALKIAEAGIEYYRWHLAHDPDDFQDGTGQTGPYDHDYYDKNGNKIGQFILDITPPESGSNVITIQSKGKIEIDDSIEKIIEVKMIRPGYLNYAIVSNSDLRLHQGTEVFGQIHSNGGIHFDGLAHNLVTSARDEYNDPDHSGNVEFGVHTHIAPVDPEPSGAVPLRPDVFIAGRDFPVPAVDFDGIISDLANIKSNAQANGLYFGDSGEEGYHIVLKNNDTFSLYKVTGLVLRPSGCVSVLGQKNWDMWSIDQETFIQNYNFPANGLVFVEDHVWVDGNIDTAKLLIAAGTFPENSSTWRHIIINNDILYTNYDGQDSLGLIAQGHITVGWVSEDDLPIDGALVAQNGRIGRYYYKGPDENQPRCSPYHVRNLITHYGTVASNDIYGYAYTDGTGYQNRNIIYDPNLIFNPPPGFPSTSDNYVQISWKEIK